ncbi:heavy metal translocating P-type ATPase [Paenibacillus nuruki]|uniref:heavy metal translocating P-type ATPase n=1 Tax=Paenibacillus nuruki TaxID=1886670 RepID=UPI002803E2AD|nr:cation-translocating P-type ATPase [Paenibacillus nuruki]CAJ1314873.1 Cadmium-exporting ATPase [Paenibacillus nuruki]
MENKEQESKSCCASTAKNSIPIVSPDQGLSGHIVADDRIPYDQRNTHTVKSTEYRIQGMDCPSCAITIEKSLKKLKGVEFVEVHFSTSKMNIAATAEPNLIMREVKRVGFDISPMDEDQERSSEPSFWKSWLPMFLSGGLLITALVCTWLAVLPVVSIVLYGAVLIICGTKPVKSAFFAVKSRSLDMNVLMSVAAIGAVWIGEWGEGATVVFLFALGNTLQQKSLERTRYSVKGLLNLAPASVWIMQQGKMIQHPVEDIQIGETIIVRAGDKIPLDGIIIDGQSHVNQAPITGESQPVTKTNGDIVYAGTLNEEGLLTIQVTTTVKDTVVARMIHMVEEAQANKAPMQAFVDRFATIYTPIVFGIAIVVSVVPPLLFNGDWSEWFYRGLELLVIACPCALVISTPVAIVSAIGIAAKKGVLIKGGSALEAIAGLQIIAFDKTGTLTEGKPHVVGTYPIEATEAELWSIASSIEQQSSHPIALSITAYANQHAIPQLPVTSVQTIAGKGVQASIDNQTYYIGHVGWLEEIGAPVTKVTAYIDRLHHEGVSIMVVGSINRIVGIITVADQVRSTASETLQQLKIAGVASTVMLTGDHQQIAHQVAQVTGVDQYFAHLLPEDKMNRIKEYQLQGKKVGMVGDGINDAPALATADVGIAMGGAGTDTAIETADIVLMADHLEQLPYAITLSRQTLRIIKQNIWFSIMIKCVALIFIFPGWLTLWVAVLSDTGAALLVILNSLRVLKSK